MKKFNVNDLKKVTALTVMNGEVTGHTHTWRTPEGAVAFAENKPMPKEEPSFARLWGKEDNSQAVFIGPNGVITHHEHNTLTTKEKNTSHLAVIGYQVEYNPINDELRRVVD